ncbi:MAG TPA: DUF6364 family protein [Thermoanaerobaculia bacterium]|nr:DUF6364 family protein [Thermoanaerobaculia bacterium]
MATAKLTVRLPREEIEFAKQYALEHRVTVAELFDRYLRRLQGASGATIHPEVEKISGLVPPDVDAKESYMDHLARKHRCE